MNIECTYASLTSVLASRNMLPQMSTQPVSSPLLGLCQVKCHFLSESFLNILPKIEFPSPAHLIFFSFFSIARSTHFAHQPVCCHSLCAHQPVCCHSLHVSAGVLVCFVQCYVPKHRVQSWHRVSIRQGFVEWSLHVSRGLGIALRPLHELPHFICPYSC